MKEADVERLVERARELHPGVTPRIISDNGPQFVAGDFKPYIGLTGMTHVRTAPHHPQPKGKIERWHRTLNTDAVRPTAPGPLDEAHRVVAASAEHYNTRRFHSVIDDVTPADRLEGHQETIAPSATGSSRPPATAAPGGAGPPAHGCPVPHHHANRSTATRDFVVPPT